MYGFTVASYDKTKDLIIDPLLASTYLGWSAGGVCNFLTLNTRGDIYLTGYTYSSNFPAASGAYDTSFNHGLYKDAFISKLDSNLSATDECVAESITASPERLTVRKNGNGKRLKSVSPASQETGVNGLAAFVINPKDEKGTAVIKFKARSLNKIATVQVKVR